MNGLASDGSNLRNNVRPLIVLSELNISHVPCLYDFLNPLDRFKFLNLNLNFISCKEAGARSELKII